MTIETYLCGKQLHRWVNERPFEVVVTNEYYDGAVSGIVQCNTGNEFYRFEMLDWDSRQQIRAFGLSALSIEVAEECLALKAQLGSNEQYPSIQPEIIYSKIQAVLLPCDSANFLIAWNRDDLLLHAIRDITELSLRLPSVAFWDRNDDMVDWFALLNLPHV